MPAILRRPLSFLLIFLPITILLERMHASPVLVFFCAALAIIPLADLLSYSTETLAHYTGSTIGGLLNSTFGNAPELIITIVMLKSGHIEMVRASIYGAILANLLLAQGFAFFLGGLKHKTQEFSSPSTTLQSTMLMIAISGMIAPGLFSSVLGEKAVELTTSLNIGICVILLSTYFLSLVYMLKTHPEQFIVEGEEGEHEEPALSKKSALTLLVLISCVIAFVSEVLVGAVDGASRALGMTEIFVGAIILSVVGGAAESSSAIVMARKNRMNLSVQIALGSSLQIAILVFPILVLLSHLISPRPMNLNMTGPGAVLMLLSVIVASMVVSEGKSTWYKGVQLIAMYLILALLIYYIPGNLPTRAH